MGNFFLCRLSLLLLILLCELFTITGLAAPNIYNSNASGKWETGTNFSLGAPHATDFIYFTNTFSKTLTIDTTTASSFSNTLTVADLTISSPTNSFTNTLALKDTGLSSPLHVISNLVLLRGGVLTLTNSALTVDVGNTPLTLANGSDVQLDGQVIINNSYFNTSNALNTTVGATPSGNGPGTFNMTNSTFTPHFVAFGNFSDGTGFLVNSTTIADTGLGLGSVPGHTGNLSIIGGQFRATNTHSGFFTDLVHIGDRGIGHLTISSNANVQFGGTEIGVIRGSVGTLTLQNGTITMDKTFLGEDAEPGPPGPTASGSIFVNGGQMSLSELHIGLVSTGLVSVAGGSLTVPMVSIGETNSATGSLNITGGLTTIGTSLTVGSNSFSHAVVSVLGGGLFVTNLAGTATTKLNGGSLFLGAGVFKTDNLIVTNAGSVITISNVVLGTTAGTTNTLALSAGGILTITNAVLGLGNDGTTNGAGMGIATITNATLNAGVLNLGSSVGGGVGTMTLQNNAGVNISSNINLVSSSLSVTSTITLNGGALTVTNGTVFVGQSGNARIEMPLGATNLFIAKNLKLGGIGTNGTGFFHLSGGTFRLVPNGVLSANLILVDGSGDNDSSAGSIIIGDSHSSLMQVDSGTSKATSMFVGFTPGIIGTLTQNGGTVNVYSNLVVGDCVSGALGVANATGGAMFVTNAAQSAVVDVRNGTFTINAGQTLVVDTISVTNTCGRFMKNGSAVLVQKNPAILSPELDADGDGQSNAAEAAAGTDPLNPSSNFRIISVVRTNSNDVRLVWTVVGGHSYVLQTNGVTGAGAFHDLTPGISVPGTAEGTANYTHTNALAGSALYYRVKLIIPP